jgi:phosphoglycerate-specific signal transduction histidine kinase
VTAFPLCVELHSIAPQHLQLVTLADEAARAKIELAEARHKAAYLADARAIQQAFEAIVQPVLDAVPMHPADSVRFTHDENGVLCLEVVRRGARPTVAAMDALQAALVPDVGEGAE